ncbi:hypothetical protein U3516DRAFT_759174 [Neocallimastix sp. 'constans']
MRLIMEELFLTYLISLINLLKALANFDERKENSTEIQMKLLVDLQKDYKHDSAPISKFCMVNGVTAQAMLMEMITRATHLYNNLPKETLISNAALSYTRIYSIQYSNRHQSFYPSIDTVILCVYKFFYHSYHTDNKLYISGLKSNKNG